MKIAIFGYAHPFTLPGHGQKYGAERIIGYLIDELLKLKHQVTVFSVKGCILPGCDFVEMPKPWDDNKDIYKEALIAYEKTHGSFDVIQSYMASGKIDVNYWMTRPYCLEPFFQAPSEFKNYPKRVIAYSKMLNARNGGKGPVIYYGIPQVGPMRDADDYLTWCGRMDPGKAPHLAIEAAKRAGKRIILLGHSYHYPYFQERIWPLVDDISVIWLRGVDDEIKTRVLAKSQGFLFPNFNHYHEAFGIVAIEALRAGCPVIGWCHRTEQSAINWEGTGEIIKDGVEGFLNIYDGWTPEDAEKSIEQAVSFIKQLKSINRDNCVSLYQNRFTSKIMTDNHLSYWKSL